MNVIPIIENVPSGVATWLSSKLREREISATRGRGHFAASSSFQQTACKKLRATPRVMTENCTDLYYNLQGRGRFHHILFMAAASSVSERQARRAQTEDVVSSGGLGVRFSRGGFVMKRSPRGRSAGGREVLESIAVAELKQLLASDCLTWHRTFTVTFPQSLSSVLPLEAAALRTCQLYKCPAEDCRPVIT